jgi:hypothetical protein
MRLLVLVMLAFGCYGDERRYGGPHALGPFRIDRETPLQSLFAQLGEPATTKGNHFCYKSRDSKRFLWIDRMAHEPGHAGDVLLSDFPNCMDRPQRVTSEDLLTWKADKGVGIGSTEDDVLKAYGKPSRQDKIDRKGYRWVIQGDHSALEERRERGNRVLVYNVDDDVRAAEFGIRDRKVAWIFLSQNE